MSKLMIPIHVDAKILSATTEVPALGAEPFATPEQLEPGVHLHWALPDALTRARTLGSSGEGAVFPAVPDLWLVVRFEAESPQVRRSLESGRLVTRRAASTLASRPTRSGSMRRVRNVAKRPSSSPTSSRRSSINRSGRRRVSRSPSTRQPASPRPSAERRAEATRSTADRLRPSDEAAKPQREARVFSARRSWRAWVVDSRAGTVTPFDEWTPPPDRPPGRLTAVGELPDAEALGHPGFGHWQPGRGDPIAQGAAYYPFSRRRFGFHDDLEGVPPGGEVSYAVIGWYAERSGDPLYRASDREELLERWKLSHEEGIRAMTLSPETLETLTDTVSDAPSSLVKESLGGALTRTRTQERFVVKEHLSAAARQVEKIAVDKGILGPGIYEFVGPSEIVCHGAVVKVPRADPSSESPSQGDWTVRLSSSIKRASAQVLVGEDSDEDSVVSTEALMQELEAQARTTAGYLDIPGALHELTFRTAPGESRFFAELHVHGKPRRSRTAARATSAREAELGAVELGKVLRQRSRTTTKRLSSGHGVRGTVLSAVKLDKLAQITKFFPSSGMDSVPTKPPPPTELEIDERLPDFIEDLRTAHASASSQAAAAGRPIMPRWIRVVDHREDAPSSIAPDIYGSSSAGWWLDLDDQTHLRALLVATWHAHQVQLPSADRLFERPGPRWYRPGAPQLMIHRIDRSYRYGFDGRYELDGSLRCRLGGRTVVSCTVAFDGVGSSPVVTGSKLLANSAAFGSGSGVPNVTRALLEEVLLFDPTNARLTAKNWRHAYTGQNEPGEAEVAEAFRAQALAWLLLRQPQLTQEEHDELELARQRYAGSFPSYIAIQHHADPWHPLFVDLRYAHAPAEIAQHELGEVEYELPESPDYPSSGPPVTHEERAFLSSALSKVSAGAVVGTFTIDHMGNKIPKGQLDLNGELFDREDLLSAALVELDDRLRGAGQQQRCGRLQVLSLDVVDVFGTRRSHVEHDQGAPLADPTDFNAPASLLGLSPRLPEWARVMFRFMSASQEGVEADFGTTPVCGFLLPDYIEHTLEVFDAEGRSVGQLRADPPVKRSAGPGIFLGARFEVHPWVEHAGDPLTALANEHLRDFVAGVVAQTTEVPAPAVVSEELSEQEVELLNAEVIESPLTELMRLFDTIGGSVAWTPNEGDRNVRLLGKAVALVRARTWLETSAGERPDETPAPHPPIPVQIGSLTRPDDGVYGIFDADRQNPINSRFLPVDLEAVAKAVINGLRDATYGTIGVRSLDHEFVQEAGPSRVALSPGEWIDLSLFVEVGGAVHLTTGVLPRKKLTLDPWFTSEAVKHMEPTFKVGPVLAVPQVGGGWQPLLPHPDLPGYEEWWVERPTGEGAYEVAAINPMPPEGQLPSGRCVMTEGWFRLEPSDPGQGESAQEE